MDVSDDNNNAGNSSGPLAENLSDNREYRIASLNPHTAGAYTCVAVNSEGSATALINLTLGKIKGRVCTASEQSIFHIKLIPFY